MQLTLLPHQIFILPFSFENFLNKTNLSEFKIYSDSELR
jgi:hypothetical protein